MPLETTEYDIWSKIAVGWEDDDCWIWKGILDTKGYGIIKYQGKRSTAHRVVWELLNGKISTKKLYVMHACDNPPCVNPRHLSVGTQMENMQDKMRKGRHVSMPGEINHKAKLTNTQAAEIRSLYETDIDVGELAERYKVSKSTIYLIANNRRYKTTEGKKTRVKGGEKSGVAKLSWPVVRYIKSEYGKPGITHKSLAERFQVSEGTIAHVLRGLTWTNDPEAK